MPLLSLLLKYVEWYGYSDDNGDSIMVSMVMMMTLTAMMMTLMVMMIEWWNDIGGVIAFLALFVCVFERPLYSVRCNRHSPLMGR